MVKTIIKEHKSKEQESNFGFIIADKWFHFKNFIEFEYNTSLWKVEEEEQ